MTLRVWMALLWLGAVWALSAGVVVAFMVKCARLPGAGDGLERYREVERVVRGGREK